MNTSSHTPLDRIPLGSSALPLRFLGMGVYLAWLYTAHFATTLFPHADGGDGLSLTFIISNCTAAVCLIACALLADRLAPLTARKRVLWTAGIVSAAGTLMTAAFGALDGGGQIILFTVGSACTGLGTALLILLWSEFYASLPMRKVSVYYSLSFVLATVLNYLVASLSPVLAIAAASALPVASVIMLATSMRILPACQDEADAHAGAEGVRWTFPIRPVLLMAVYSFAFGFVRETNDGATPFGMIGVGLIAAVVLVANLLFFHRFDTRLLYRLALPLMVAALLIGPLFGAGGVVVADVLANASYAGFVILTMIILSGICFRFGVNALWLFGLTRASRVVANVAGVFFGGVSAQAEPFVGSLMLMAVVVVLVAGSMFLLNDQDFRSAWGIVPQAEHGASESLNYYDTFLGRCAQVAREYGLTHREEEVLALLAQGKSVPAIEKDLVISNGTAKSHVRHIYRKLGIHARDELIDLVGMRGRGSSSKPSSRP